MPASILDTLRDLVIPMDAVKPFPKNPRRGDVEFIKWSLSEKNQYRPIVVNRREGARYGDGTIIAGNHTCLAARELGWTEIAATFVDVDDDTARDIALIDNASADRAYNDPELLAALLKEAPDPESAGYSEEFLGDLLAGLPRDEVEGETDPDAIPDPPAESVSKLGDLWLLGEHRVLCGDATIADDVKRLMNGEVATLMATDPPYLVDYDGSNHPGHTPDWSKSRERLWDAYKDQAASVDFYRSFLAVAMEHAIEESAAIYQWHADLRRQLVIAAWEENGLLAHQTIIWAKSNPVLTRSHFMWQHDHVAARARPLRLEEGPPAEEEPKAACEREHGLADRQGLLAQRPPSHGQARRSLLAPDRLAHEAGRGLLRAVRRIRLAAHRRAHPRKTLLRNRDLPGVCGRYLPEIPRVRRRASGAGDERRVA